MRLKMLEQKNKLNLKETSSAADFLPVGKVLVAQQHIDTALTHMEVKILPKHPMLSNPYNHPASNTLDLIIARRLELKN